MQEFCQDQDRTCKICMETLNEPFRITDCQHEFCKVCAKEYFESKIDERLIDEFRCPLCQKSTDVDQILQIIDQLHQERYHEQKNEKFQFQKQRKEMIKFYINNKNKLNLCRCPWCEQIFHRAENGCNYIRCHSLECQGRNTFCAQCDVALTDLDHEKHYENNNPFKGKCRVLNNGEWVDRSTKKY